MNMTRHGQSPQSFWYLENFNAVNMFCPGKVSQRVHTFEHKRYDKGEYIYLQGQQADKIFVILEGRVKIATPGETGKEITKVVLNEGEVFGELTLAGVSQRQNYAQAMEPTVLCLLSIDQMKKLIRDHSALSLFFLKILGDRMLEMERRLESLVFKDSRTRVVEYLVDLCKSKGERVGYEWVVRKFLTHQEIANITATSRQTVTTVLNELETRNILTYDRRRLLIRNLEMLESEKMK